MRIGFVTRLLWDRYGRFWRRLVEAAGADVVLPDPERVAAAAADRRLDAVSGRAFREAAGQALALSGVDRLVVPELNPGYEGSRGSAQDPFVADFPGALAQVVPGLPPLVAVPADLAAPDLESRAVALLTAVAPSHGAIRRVWETHRADAKPVRPAGLPGAGAERRTIALVGQPWHLDEALRVRLERGGERLLSAHQLAPRDLREEGWRADPELAPTDAEALGAVRRFARRGDVRALRMPVDPDSGADAWLARKARAWSRRPLETVPLAGDGAPADAPAVDGGGGG
jgi:hypothetical protein